MCVSADRLVSPDQCVSLITLATFSAILAVLERFWGGVFVISSVDLKFSINFSNVFRVGTGQSNIEVPTKGSCVLITDFITFNVLL